MLMPEPKPNLNIIAKPEKLFRDEGKNKKENLTISFSGELENTHRNKYKAEKRLEALDKNIDIGNVYYNEINNSFEIKESIRDPKYSGNEVGLNLYKELIRIAETKKLDSIKSDSMVQQGAMVIWKKLIDLGYHININPKIKDKYQEFVKIYNEGKYFTNYLGVSPDESVFELILDRKKD